MIRDRRVERRRVVRPYRAVGAVGVLEHLLDVELRHPRLRRLQDGVETPAGENRLFYISTLVSNVLRKNSAVDHQTMGTRIHRLIEKAHPEPVPDATAEPVTSAPMPE